MGKFKWQKLNIPYQLENIRTATDEDIKRAKEILKIKQNAFNAFYFILKLNSY